MDCLLSKLQNEDISNRIYIVGIDGLGGAGKSTLANSLKLQLCDLSSSHLKKEPVAR